MIIAVGGSEENNVGIAGIDRRLDEDLRGLVRHRANLDIGGTCERGDALLLGLHRFGVVLQEGIGPRDRQGVVSRWKGREYDQGKRSEERRVGKGCVRTGRFWGWPDH